MWALPQVDKAVAASIALRGCLNHLKEGVDGIAMRRGLDIDIESSLMAASQQEQDQATVHQAMTQARPLLRPVHLHCESAFHSLWRVACVSFAASSLVSAPDSLLLAAHLSHRFPRCGCLTCRGKSRGAA